MVWVVEAWRGLAAWLVVYAHFGTGMEGSPAWMRFAFTGVDLFFVLSGFVFAPYLFGKPLALKAFWVRRFFRIYPAFLLALLVYAGMKWAQGAPLLYVWEHLSFTYLQSREMAFYYNPVFWSLPSEVEFYLLLPLLAWGCRRRLWAVALLVVAAMGLRMVLGYASDRGTFNLAFLTMYHLPGVLVEFLLGACAWHVGQKALGVRPRLLLALAGLTLWWVLAHWFGQAGDAGIDATWARGQLSWLAALGFAAMVAASAGRWDNAPARVQHVALWAGRLSYGVYLFHTAALHGAQQLWPEGSVGGTTAIAVCLTLGLAWVSFRFWEDPWRKWGRKQAGNLEGRG